MLDQGGGPAQEGLEQCKGCEGVCVWLGGQVDKDRRD